MDDVAEHHLVNLVTAHGGPLQRFASHQGAQLRGGEILEAAAEVADGGTHSTYDYHFTLFHWVSSVLCSSF
ncbi:hypothetical protein D3C80_2059190 [compost metagenome]